MPLPIWIDECPLPCELPILKFTAVTAPIWEFGQPVAMQAIIAILALKYSPIDEYLFPIPMLLVTFPIPAILISIQTVQYAFAMRFKIVYHALINVAMHVYQSTKTERSIILPISW